MIAPCTGNTLAKLVNGIIDTPVIMAAKAQLRNQKPVVLAVATNDGLGINARNLGLAMNIPNVYMVPFGQDAPFSKQNSTVAYMDKIIETMEAALDGLQLQPVIL